MAYLRENFLVGLSSHVGVSPGVNSNIVARRDNMLELFGVANHVQPNQKVGSPLVVIIEELKELVRFLWKMLVSPLRKGTLR
jgi:hypothetical protein